MLKTLNTMVAELDFPLKNKPMQTRTRNGKESELEAVTAVQEEDFVTHILIPVGT